MLNRPQSAKESEQLDKAFLTLHGTSAWDTILAWVRSEEMRLARVSRHMNGEECNRTQGGSLALESLDHHYQQAVKAHK